MDRDTGGPAGPGDDVPGDEPVGGSGADLLRQRASSTPERTALVDAGGADAAVSETRSSGDGTWTYGVLDERVDAFLAGLARVGDPDGRVCTLLDARPAVAEAYFAVARRGGSVVPLNVRLDAATLADQAERAAADLVVCERETEDLALDAAPDGTPVASVDEPDREGVRSIDRRRAAPLDPVETGPGAERLVMFTSGTTGEPKGVRLTRRNLAASAVSSARRLGVDPGDRWLVPLPTYHMGGFAPMLRSTLYGTTAVLYRGFDVEATAEAFDDHGITGVSLVPTQLSRLLDAGWSPPDRLRFVLLGGAPASRELVTRALDRGVPVHPTYGLTETASQVTTATPAEAEEYPGTVGRPLDGTTVTVVEDGDPVATGETGQVVVAGPTVTPGYLDDDRTAAAFGPDGLHTGDVGYRDDAGRLWVVGRVDDRIVTGGENVQPGRVADALRSVPGVADAAVVGLPDDEWGERVAALVVPDDDADLTPDAVTDDARDRLADFEVPKTATLAEGLPRTASGTVDREAVRERLRRERRGADGRG
ncbi:MAG: class I adenylate-forming enzyme family protein [Haloarculaceae archaeon]